MCVWAVEGGGRGGELYDKDFHAITLFNGIIIRDLRITGKMQLAANLATKGSNLSMAANCDIGMAHMLTDTR